PSQSLFSPQRKDKIRASTTRRRTCARRKARIDSGIPSSLCSNRSLIDLQSRRRNISPFTRQ
ncbi:hypothetical protein PMAYCL1PPCAC_21877, partial [Pristionchus mayeri]